MRLILRPQFLAPVLAFLVAAGFMFVLGQSFQRPDFTDATMSWGAGETQRAAVAAAHLGSMTNLVLLTVAFTGVSLITIRSSWEAVKRITGQTSFRPWIGPMVALGVIGAFSVVLDPIGPMIGCNVSFFPSCGLGQPDAPLHLTRALQDGIISGLSLATASCLVLFTGTLAGPLVAAVLIYFSEVAAKTNDLAALQQRKQGFLRIVGMVSVALSLGVAIIDAFLTSSPFLMLPVRRMSSRTEA